MANTYVDYTASASQTDFAFSFPYLEDTHVVVEIDGFDKIITTDFTIPSNGLVRLNSGATAGQLVRVKRVSDFATDLVNFVNGSVLNEADLDKAYLHNRYLNEEAYEANLASLQLAGGGIHFNANNNKIINLATPTADKDAVNKSYIDTRIALSGTSLNGFDKSTHTGDNTETQFTLSFTAQVATPEAYLVTIDGVVQTPTTAYSVDTSNNKITFTSAPPTSANIVVVPIGTSSSANDAAVVATGSTTSRSLASRFADVINVLDYGAAPANVDNRTAINAAFTAAFNAGGGTVYFPAGTYTVTDYVGFVSSSTDEINIEVIAEAGAVLNVNPSTSASYGLLLESANLKTCIVRGLEVQCNDKVAVGIRATNNSGSMDIAVVEGCRVYNCKQLSTTSAQGILVYSTGWGYKATVENCIVQGVSRSVSGVCQALAVRGFENSNIVNNTVTDVTHFAGDDSDADGIVVFSHNSAFNYKRSQVSVRENVVKNCEGRFIKLQTEGAVTVESNLLRLDGGTLITNFKGVDTQVANATIRNNQMYILGYTGGDSASFAALQAPSSSNFSSNESFVSEFCFNNIHCETRFRYGILATSPNANEDPTVHFKINDNTITRNVASGSSTATDVACGEFVRLGVSTPAAADFDATFYLEIARNKVFTYDFIRIPFTQDDYTDKWFFYVYDNYRFPTGFTRDVVLGGNAPTYNSPYTSTCMFRNNQTSPTGGNVGWPLDASKILEGSDFDLSGQTLTNMPNTSYSFGRLGRRGGSFIFTRNDGRASYTSADPTSGWVIVGSLETASLANITNATSAINTIGKYSGKQVFETTTPRVMVAGTAAATGVWYVVDGSASVTPS